MSKSTVPERAKKYADNFNASQDLTLQHASLREKAAMVDELQKRAERMQKALSDIAEWTDRYTSPGHPISTIARAAIAKERQS